MNKSMLNNLIWLLSEKVVRLVVGFLVSIWLARYLGPENFGILAYSLATLMVAQSISKLGLDGIVIRDLSTSKTPEVLISTTIAMRFFTGTLVYLILLLALYIFEDKQTVIIFSMVGLSLVFQNCETIDLYFQSISKNKLSVISKLSSYIIINIIRAACIYFDCPLYIFAILVSVEFAITSIFLFSVYTKLNLKLVKADFSIAHGLIKESWPFMLSSLASVIYMRVDQIFIKNYLSNEFLGYYSIVVALSSQFHFIPMVFQKIFTPYLSKLKVNNIELYEMRIENLFSLYALIGWLICIPIYYLSDYIVVTLYGPSYSPSVDVLKIYIFTNFFIMMGMGQTIWMTIERKSKLSLKRTIFGLIVCLIMNLLLVPEYGLIGAAISSVSAQAAQSVLSNIFFERKILLTQIKAMLVIPTLKGVLKF